MWIALVRIVDACAQPRHCFEPHACKWERGHHGLNLEAHAHHGVQLAGAQKPLACTIHEHDGQFRDPQHHSLLCRLRPLRRQSLPLPKNGQAPTVTRAAPSMPRLDPADSESCEESVTAFLRWNRDVS